MTFEIGSLVRARGREWVVLPESRAEENLLVLRPLGGSEEEIAGIFLPLEKVEPARFPLPDPTADLGNHLSCGLLRDAVRLGFRSAAGPLRSLGRIAVEPRPYQLVPLLMALRLDTIRLLIADDVGVGKTIEALLIARELLDRGEVQRLAVLCPPHLAEQWQRALRDQFHIDAALVLASTAGRLERDCGVGESLFDRHPHVVVSMDYIKSPARFDTFARACPELVIVDEAHGCTDAGGGRGAGQQRHKLLRKLVEDRARHMLLVTATPHSGNTDAFRSLLSLLDPAFADLPDDLGGEVNRKQRERLAQHVVQRQRGDVKAYLATSAGEETPFPTRMAAEATYGLHADYTAFFQKVVRFCRERVLDESGSAHRQRVRWWSALALLRSIGSSPAAAAATLRNRAVGDSADSPEEADQLGRRAVLDLDDETEGTDVPAGVQEGEEPETDDRKALLRLAREADKLGGESDRKLQEAIRLIKKLLADGFHPIVFCRFIPTVDYVKDALRRALGKNVTVEGVTGALPSDERERRVDAMATGGKRVLVCTDCLSEGINLQHAFDAVVHYDLSWNPTRHEQREGRVDRYGQLSKVVQTLTFWGADNPIDLVVRDKLLEKHKKILRALGIFVPVPQESDRLVEALVRQVFFGKHDPTDSRQLKLAIETENPGFREVEIRWEAAAEREKTSRALFAQHAIKPDEVAAEVAAVRKALGASADVERFVRGSFESLGATVTTAGPPFAVRINEIPAALRDALGERTELSIAFGAAAPEGTDLLTRTHPVVAALAAHVLESALDPSLEGPGKRAGVIRTGDVAKRTVALLLRMRFHIVTKSEAGERPLLAEDVALVAFEGTPDAPSWLSDEASLALLTARPTANVAADLARTQLERVLERFAALAPALDDLARRRGEELLAAHRRVRAGARSRDRTARVEPHLPSDVLGLYVFLPAGGGG